MVEYRMLNRNRFGLGIEKLATLVEARFLTCITVILILGTVLRILFIWLTTSPTETLNLFWPGYTDGEDYSNIARSLVETGVYGYGGRPSAYRSPAYPFWIALIWKIFGESLTLVRLLQIALFVGMTICYAYVTLKYFGKFAAALTALVFSVYPLFVFMTTEIATENLYMPLASIVFALTLMLLHNKKQGKGNAIVALAAGLFCGAGILTRPNMLFVFLMVQALIAWYAFTHAERSRNWITSFIGLWIGALLVTTPWAIRNQLQLGAPVLTTEIYYVFFRGTFDFVDGIPNGQSIFSVFSEHHVIYEDQIEDPKKIRLPISEVENEKNARAAALAIIRSDPALWFKERGKNLLYFWLNLQWELRDGSERPELVEKRPIVVAAAALVTIVYYVLLLGAIVGSISVWRGDIGLEQRLFVAVAWSFILAAMSVVITTVGKRYRVAMIDPYLVMLACVGIASWLNRLRRPVLGR